MEDTNPEGLPGPAIEKCNAGNSSTQLSDKCDKGKDNPRVFTI
ncbi:hypothetical protein J2X72_002981 [Phyllobacterium sp. 1468]|nr:hypothetical protein [Phyllobacterium sp. 1468]MDR6634181.1 hypothetical protein [Phyllobacterium sp. 1468]